MVKGFSRVQIGLHWFVAVLVIYQLLMGDDMSHLWRQIRQNAVTPTTTGAWVHIILGSLVLLLVLWRLMLRFTRGVPDAAAGESRALMLAGSAGHVALYALLLALPVTGLLAWYGGVTSLADLHGGILKALLWVMIGLHVLAALWHQFIRKDRLIERMLRPE
ncbi:MAG: cytochrome b/b6 domain-containing protein [Paracoccaceae bacterium]